MKSEELKKIFANALIWQKVANSVNKEISYQNAKWGVDHVRNQTVEGHLLVLRKKLQDAEDGWMKNLSGRNSVESELIQVVAVAMQALVNIEIKRQDKDGAL
ncbi:hypothetical protein ABC502_14395 [Alkalimonas sp. NCh-2]|uniref:hypothetical protein n=1 Tax=Alkalimonas sp. NCh-2 TaxID=3144846 RepID=UPI0031F62E52